ncbi:MAG: MGMT family protein [Candidatus Doudnabacteria bacterium]|nr:MGMT family protein [Candidatus Doudnabacteria bacterium]
MKKINWDKYNSFQQKVYRAILKIPAGEVMTYGQVAKKIGHPGAARAVGTALSKNLDAPIIPCHRVITSNGKMGGYSGRGGIKGKIKLLRKEGYLV